LLSFSLESGLTRDGAFPPALEELQIEFDRDAAIEVGGVPRCELGGREIRRSLDGIRRICGPAIVGAGVLRATFAFPEEALYLATADLLILNRGEEGGAATLFAVAHFDQPMTLEMVMPIEIKRRPGSFGLRATMKIRPIANGYGHLERLQIALHRRLASKDRPDGIFRLRCSDGETATQVRASFADGAAIDSATLRTCEPKRSRLARQPVR
jgi:hypothetical protein